MAHGPGLLPQAQFDIFCSRGRLVTFDVLQGMVNDNTRIY